MPVSYVARRLRRLAAVAALVLGVLALLYVLVLRPSTAYTVHAIFRDAGQLVTGDPVEVGGRTVGTVADLRLTPDGLADVVMHVGGGYDPLREGTQARIRAPGLAGVANRYVELAPGPASAAAIPDGGQLPPADTHGIVDLDVLLDSVDPTTRRQLSAIFRRGSSALAAPAAGQFNAGIHYLSPALGQSAALLRGVAGDQAALSRLVSATADVSSTLAAHQRRLGGAVSHSAAALSEIAAHRAALADSLSRAPAVLDQAGAVLRHTTGTLAAVDPALIALRPVAPRLARLLRLVGPAGRDAIPALAEVRALLPGASRALSGLPAAARTGVPAVISSTAAIKASLPVISGMLPYAPDIIAGFFNGFDGSSAGYYDANGHYARIDYENGQGGGAGLLSLLPPFPVPTLDGLRTGLLHRCPGGAVEPAPDNSNPYVPPGLPGLCVPAEDHR